MCFTFISKRKVPQELAKDWKSQWWWTWILKVCLCALCFRGRRLIWQFTIKNHVKKYGCDGGLIDIIETWHICEGENISQVFLPNYEGGSTILGLNYIFVFVIMVMCCLKNNKRKLSFFLNASCHNCWRVGQSPL